MIREDKAQGNGELAKEESFSLCVNILNEAIHAQPSLIPFCLVLFVECYLMPCKLLELGDHVPLPC
ncbi:hypothetical protein COLO4_30013 [Corchorus olitorius]|uniref:Uncharacterized protein n=1 Tax=Corchorus olitorius TaxID=93759 RepID=A0A1R3HBL1_9ROSI|nr:hypothetical protein COLO4_30013 [Corchorus olitorius]